MAIEAVVDAQQKPVDVLRATLVCKNRPKFSPREILVGKTSEVLFLTPFGFLSMILDSKYQIYNFWGVQTLIYRVVDFDCPQLYLQPLGYSRMILKQRIAPVSRYQREESNEERRGNAYI